MPLLLLLEGLFGRSVGLRHSTDPIQTQVLLYPVVADLYAYPDPASNQGTLLDGYSTSDLEPPLYTTGELPGRPFAYLPNSLAPGVSVVC